VDFRLDEGLLEFFGKGLKGLFLKIGIRKFLPLLYGGLIFRIKPSY